MQSSQHEGRMQDIDIEALNQRFEEADPRAVLEWVGATFGADAAATSSFQTQSVPLLHLIAQTVPELPILFLDTGFHFSETLEFRDHLQEEFGLNVHSLTTQLGHDGFREKHGALHRRDPDLCCHINKVKPLERALDDYAVWVSGIRRDQTDERKGTPVVSQLDDGLYKVCPMVSWTSRDIWQYMNEHDLPAHPLFEEGFFSIGCAPCTRRPGHGGDERDGRWAGMDKQECGLHTDVGAPVQEADE